MSRTKRRQKGNPELRELSSPRNWFRNNSSRFKTAGQYFQTDCPVGDHTKDLKDHTNQIRRQRERQQISEFVKNGVDLAEESDYDKSYEESASRILKKVYLW